MLWNLALTVKQLDAHTVSKKKKKKKGKKEGQNYLDYCSACLFIWKRDKQYVYSLFGIRSIGTATVSFAYYSPLIVHIDNIL